jgi:hypothetical protein
VSDRWLIDRSRRSHERALIRVMASRMTAGERKGVTIPVAEALTTELR